MTLKGVVNRDWIVYVAAAAMAGIFYWDIQTELGISEHILYLAPLAALVMISNWRVVYLFALAITIVTTAGFFLSPAGGNAHAGFWNRGFTIGSAWSVALLVATVIRGRLVNDIESWIRLGKNDLSAVVRGELTVEQVAGRAIEFLAKYTDAQVGVVYVVDPIRRGFARVASYAFAEGQQTLPDLVRVGEGILGQSAADNRIIAVSDVPVETIGALNVNAGLASFPARHILAVPLSADASVVGVAAFGFMKAPTPQALELYNRIGEIFGVALRSAHTKARLAELLEDSRRQAQELQSQGEELKVINEELESQTTALRESQANLENQQAELEQTNSMLEEQTTELERQREVTEERNRELMRIQNQLRDQASELLRASQYKTEFLANMSHELRTPLNSSLILSKLLSDNRDGNLTEEQVRYAETIRSAGTDLLNLINDILDLAKVEAGKIELNPERSQVASLAASLERSFEPLAKAKGILLKTEVLPGTPSEIVTDRQRLEQILRNLLANAIKFTERGEVAMRVSPSPKGLVFAVSDTGIGIPADQHEVIFEAFRQADGTVNRKYGGTGLGLSISRELATLLGGRITIASSPGEGSTFSIELPLECPEQHQTEAPKLSMLAQAPIPEHTISLEPVPTKSRTVGSDDTPKSGQPRKVLIVEDDTVFAEILQGAAVEMGFEPLVTDKADEAVRLAVNDRPLAVLLDLRLHDHSGMSVLDRLKRDTRTRHIPVHIVSATDASRAALHMGAASFMVKPVERERILEVFAKLEDRTQNRVKRVLIVEDDPGQGASLTALVKDTGAEIVLVDRGSLALEKIAQGESHFDCMILDLQLPDMTGFELLEKLAKSSERFAYPPVIVYTGRELTRADEERLRRYSESVIIKGAKSPERLLSDVTLFLHRVESELPAERQRMLRELRSRERTLEGRKVLVVDDDIRNVFALTSALETQGARVLIARNGREALEKLKEAPDTDIVLMDTMMPEMDGIEATRQIRALPKHARLPIIAVTAKAMRNDQEQCLEAGASDYLAKPVDVDKLLSLIRVWMPTERRA